MSRRQQAYIKSAANKVRQSPFVIPLFYVFITMLLVSILLSVEDYRTTYEGIQMLPTRKVTSWIVIVAALVPWLAQVGFGYFTLVIEDNDSIDRKLHYGSIAIYFFFMAFDVGTDVFFKVWGVQTDMNIYTFMGAAIVETIMLYTIMAEVMLVVGFGMVWELYPDVAAQTRVLPYVRKKKLDDVMDKHGVPKQKPKREKKQRPATPHGPRLAGRQVRQTQFPRSRPPMPGGSSR